MGIALLGSYRKTKSGNEYKGERIMLKWGFFFLIVAIVAGILGFTGVAGAASFIAKVIFVVALVIFLAALAMAISIAK